MSYVVEIVRPIAPKEFLALIAEDPTLTLLEHADDWVEAGWSDGDEHAVFSLAQGRIAITTPSERAWDKAQEIARRLDARVIGEEDEIKPPQPIDPEFIADRSINLGWPILVLVLTALLIWRW